jgi:hypothetical protein
MPEGTKELVQVGVDPPLDRRLERVARATGLDHGTIVRWAILTQLPYIESTRLPNQAQQSRAVSWDDGMESIEE